MRFGFLVLGAWLALMGGAGAGEALCSRPVPSVRMGAASMAPALPEGSLGVVACWPHAVPSAGTPPAAEFATLEPRPARGDIIVFLHPRDAGRVWVKRVIGLPGDLVRFRSGRLHLNGQEVPREEIGQNPTARHYREYLPEGPSYEILETSDQEAFDNTPEYRVPADQLFVVGDNRDESLDSRAMAGFGFVHVDLLVGRVVRLAR